MIALVVVAALALAQAEAVAVAQGEAASAESELAAEVRQIAARVEQLRGEPFTRPPVALRVPEDMHQTAAEIRAYNVLPRERLAARGRAWADLGLGPVDTPARLYLTLAADLAGVALDPREDRLFLGPELLPERDFHPTEAPEDPATVLLLTGMRPDEPLVAHELAHLRQRQRASGDTLETTTDGLLARAAWIEGEANLVAVRYLFSAMHVTEDVMQHVRSPGEVLGGVLLPRDLAGRSGVLRELVSFVYLDGFERAAALHRSGGWAAVESAAAARRTTRDLLHAARPPLEQAVFPEARPPAPGLRLADEDSLGEQAIVLWVSTLTGKENLGLLSGDGWAGDRVYRWERPGDEAAGMTEWVTTWTAVPGDARAPAEVARDFEYGCSRALEARFPGRAFAATGEGVRTLVGPDRLVRLTRQGTEVRLLIRPLEPAPRAPSGEPGGGGLY